MLLRQNVSFLMFPFTLMKKGDNPDIGLDRFRMPGSAVWKPYAMNVDENVFFAHIQSFLQKSVTKGADGLPDMSTCDFMVFSCIDQYLNDYVFNSENTYTLQGKKQPHPFAFYNDVHTFLSPKLVVYPDASVGLMVLPVKLIGEQVDMKDLMDFNNVMQKLDKQKREIVVQGPKRTANEWKSGIEGIEGPPFYLANLVKMLLSGLNEAYPCQLFMPKRCHVFSYLNVCQAEAEKAVADDWKDDLLRISRCQNSDFQVLPEERAVKQTFQNVYIAVNVEGGAMMTVSDIEFYQNFLTDNFVQRYYWLYVLVLMQRYSLINMSRGIGAIDNDGDRKNIVSLRRLRNLSNHLTRIKVNSYFSDVSDYTQHNEFYHFCCERLGVVRLLIDVEQKMRTLDDCLRLKVEKRSERTQFALALSVMLLTTFSGVNDALQLSDHNFFSLSCDGCIVNTLRMFFCAAIAFIFYLLIRRWIK